MNESGRAVAPLLKYYNIDEADLTVMHDDLDSPVGRVRLRQKGSSGGQNGIKSVITHVGSQIFNRVNRDPSKQAMTLNHVLLVLTMKIRKSLKMEFSKLLMQ
ncbi:Peptidyl-tRNA hydrolase [Lactococcus cremoris]|nr:Peptidyl-tRNA hydrolase [Lactococcus cremoris]